MEGQINWSGLVWCHVFPLSPCLFTYHFFPQINENVPNEKYHWKVLLSSVQTSNLITSAEREVKDSRHSGMYQSYNFLTRLGMQSL